MKAQVALEYVTVTGFALILVTGLLYTALHVQQTTNDQAAQQALTNIADTLQQELLLAASVHDGYTRTFSLPPDAAGTAYWIDAYNNSFTAHIPGYSQPRRAPAYSGAPAPGSNTITKTNNTITIQ